MPTMQAEMARVAGLRREIEAAELAMRHGIGPAQSDAQLNLMRAEQARADVGYAAHGLTAPPPIDGEAPTPYARRLAAGLQRHSATWAAANLHTVAADALGVIAPAIYADAVAAANDPRNVPAGTLREIITTDPSGRKVSTFVGSPSVWMDDFKIAKQGSTQHSCCGPQSRIGG